jgi:signal transduction histidine kinase
MPRPRIPQHFRRAAAYGLLVTVLEAAFVVLLAWSRADAAERNFDARLLAAALDAARRAAPNPVRRGLTAATEAVERSRDLLLYVEVTDRRGKPLGRSNITLPPLLPFQRTLARSEDFPDGARFGDVHPAPGDSGIEMAPVLRHVALPYADESGDAFVVHAVAKTTGGRELIADLLFGLQSLVPVSFAAAAVCAWMLERRAMRPVGAVAAAAAQVTPGTLRQGIAVVGVDGQVAELQLALNQALQRLDDAFEEQSRFAANVSHELKTPIAVLLAQAQVLDPAKASPEEITSFRASIEAEMRRLGRTVESFLLLARCGPDAALKEARPVPLLDVVLDSVKQGSELAAQYGVTLVPQIDLEEDSAPPVVRGDPHLLRTMLDNLVSNAVRFSPPGEAVDVRATATDREARITVRDRGPGIPAGYERAVFDRFTQAPVEAPRRGGFGLGLNIAATIARMHQGSIDARNRLDRGCEFVVSLPTTTLDEEPVPVPSAEPAEPGPAEGG